MAKLIVSLEGSVIRDYPLEKERVTIGRKPHNDIQIENLAVSGEHACIVTILNDSFLEDLGSTNGTLVNGNPIKKHILQNNDVVEIGKYKLKYVTDAPMAGRTTVDEFEKTMVMRSPALARAAGRSASGAATSGPRTMGMPTMPPPTPRPVHGAPTFPPGGTSPAVTAPPEAPRSREIGAAGTLTSPGGRDATASRPPTSPPGAGKDATASRLPASPPQGKEATASGHGISAEARAAAAAGSATSPGGKALVSGPITSPGGAAVVSVPGGVRASGALARAASGPTATSPGGATASTAADAPAVLGAIQILSGSGAGKELDLVKNLTTLGKPGVQVAVITRRPQGYFITHVEGATSPEVNGKALDAQARLLHDHDVIELAGVKMEFFLKK